jgi:hypothetical protein
MPLFIAKLASKGQTVAQQAEDQRAIGYYAGLLSPTLEPAKSETAPPARVPPVAKPALAPRINQQGAEVRQEPGTLIWQEVADKLKEQIMLRHYSPKTLKAYAGWMWKLCRFLGYKLPETVTSSDIQRFLADLAVRQQVSASAQNQAFNALLFLFRHVSKRDLGDLSDTPRAKRRRSIPTVLSRSEVTSLIAELQPPYRLMGMILYG